jgi:epoxyqueuosine reductase QueG
VSEGEIEGELHVARIDALAETEQHALRGLLRMLRRTEDETVTLGTTERDGHRVTRGELDTDGDEVGERSEASGIVDEHVDTGASLFRHTSQIVVSSYGAA